MRQSAYISVLPAEVVFKTQGLTISYKTTKNSLIKIEDGSHSVFVEPKELTEFIQVFRDIENIYELMLNSEQGAQVSDTTEV
jgi:hypothetical protein